MKVLLIGGGGREHALALKLAQSPRLTQLYIAPGNTGTAQVGTNVPIPETDHQGLIAFAKEHHIDLTFVGPEGPLVAGIVDAFQKENLVIIGPNRKAAMVEGSKKWTKELMKKYGIPTAAYGDFTELNPALAYIEAQNTYPIVIKADGLAAGKGVTIAQSYSEAKEALENCFIHQQFAEAGSTVVIEAFLQGEEATLLAFSDGTTVIPMVSAQDHKAVFDSDKGPNTGGMGAYSPAPIVTPEVEKLAYEQVLKPMIDGMKRDGIPFKGILYAGLMIHNNTPYVVEFNARFGDPETQIILPRLETDLLAIFEAIHTETLHTLTLEWSPYQTVCVVLASEGYPGNFEKHKPITGTEFFNNKADIQLVHAGTTPGPNNTILSNGGRVLGVVAWDKELKIAIEKAYQGVHAIHFENKYFRTDIAQKALRKNTE